MAQMIDCLLIGHNQVEFQEYERSVRKMGINSGAYRDLNINTLQYNNKIYSASDIFNLFCSNKNPASTAIKPIGLVETFSAGIAYLGTYLNRGGYTFDYVNSFHEEKENLASLLIQDNILVIGILTTLYVTALPVLEIISFIREYNHTAKIVLGGPLVSTKIRTMSPLELDCLFKSIDADFYINSSQGEAALLNIIDALKNNSPYDKINNIYYKTGEEYRSTPISRENNILSGNMVNWDLFSDRVKEFVNVRTGISCPFSCSFCGFPAHAGKYQVAGVEAVEKELDLLNKIDSVKSITFVDDTFNIPVKRFKEILKMMIKNKYSFKWNSFFRCQFADREMVELMKESGCESVLLGLESGNEQILKNMNKCADLKKFLKGIALLGEYGIVTFGNFIVGFPGETGETVTDTIRFIEASGLDFYRTQLWYCEPITPIWQERDKYGLKGDSFEWSHDTMDSKAACDWIREIILSVEGSIRYPQYYFDYDNVIQLLYKGMSLNQVKKYLKHLRYTQVTKMNNCMALNE